MNARTGKIARLPHEIRQQLNQRLRDGLEAAAILPWLNSLPEVQSVVAAQFAGLPVSEQNLSAWRSGGFQDWLRRREACDFIGALDEDMPSDPDAEPLPETLANSPVRKLMRWIAIQYAATAAELASMEDSEERWTRLRQFCADLSRLNNADLHSEALRLGNERLGFARARAADSEKRQVFRSLTPAFLASMVGRPPKAPASPKHDPDAKSS